PPGVAVSPPLILGPHTPSRNTQPPRAEFRFFRLTPSRSWLILQPDDWSLFDNPAAAVFGRERRHADTDTVPAGSFAVFPVPMALKEEPCTETRVTPFVSAASASSTSRPVAEPTTTRTPCGTGTKSVPAT